MSGAEAWNSPPPARTLEEARERTEAVLAAVRRDMALEHEPKPRAERNPANYWEYED